MSDLEVGVSEVPASVHVRASEKGFGEFRFYRDM